MTRFAKIVVAVALLAGVASPAMAQPWSNTSTKCHPRSMYGQYNYRPSTYGFSPGTLSAASGLGYGYQTYRVPSYGYNYGYSNFNYPPVYVNPQAYGFGPYNW